MSSMMCVQYLLYGHRNLQGSIYAVTNATGDAVERYAYDAYGVPSIFSPTGDGRAATAISNEILYTGRTWDAATKLYQYRARWYSPNLGRFVSRDPIDYSNGDKLLYLYAQSRPLFLRDPSGLRPPTGIPFLPRNGNPTPLDGDRPICSKTCIFTMQDNAHLPGGNFFWEREGDTLLEWLNTTYNGPCPPSQNVIIKNVDSPGMVGQAVAKNACCQIVMIGHRGGDYFAGGIVTYPYEEPNTKPVVILPTQNQNYWRSDLEAEIEKAQQANCRHGCRILLYTCNGGNEKEKKARKKMANQTGCTVCGTSELIGMGANEAHPMTSHGQLTGVDLNPISAIPFPPVTCESPSPNPPERPGKWPDFPMYVP